MNWLPDLQRARRPIYAAIVAAIGEAVEKGELAPGERLPSQRAMADRLGLDLTTITRAYTRAAELGLIDSDGRRGSYVRGAASAGESDPAGQELASGMNMPPEPEGGMLRRSIREGMAALLEGGLPPLHYQPSGGTPAERAAAARYLSALIPGTSPDQVTITAGAQNALHAVCGLVLERGMGVAAGRYCYPGFLSLARGLQANVIAVECDGEGMLPEALERAVRRQGVRAVYLVPTNDNPTARTMGLQRRKDIAAVAIRHGLTIIEDDAYGRLPDKPLKPLATHAPDLTWHISGISKLITPSLRIAFLRAPQVRDSLRITGALHDSAVMAPPLNVALVARWLADGTFPRLVRAVRAEAEVRQKAALALLDPHGATGFGSGYHLWLPLPAGRGDALAAQAAAAGLPVAPSPNFAVEEERSVQALRVSLGGCRSRERVARDMRRLDALLAEPRRRAQPIV
jgi:DNA-binding transcriptional MocR family regulator